MIFRNRYDAALKLIERLEKYKNERGVVLAVPRGGIPIGYYIAMSYNMPLELMMSKKIGHPISPEFAIGSVDLEDYFIDEQFDIPQSYIDQEIRTIRKSLKERYRKFMGNREPTEVAGKMVIITDDGIATGHTLLSAIRIIRKKHPRKIVVAVPVAPRKTAEKIRNEVDDFICLHIADDFQGVGQYYEDFSEISDEEAIHFFQLANHIDHAA
jgi:putative phosphoribosyl transferase